MTDYTVFLEQVFRGPMDLLLHLVREQEVEIHEVEISKVIKGYTEYLDALRELDIEVAGEFTVMAATLMAIKSRSLLPREEISLEDELDPKDELIQRLLEYRRFKEASDTLGKGLEVRQSIHPRGAFPELAEERSADEPVLDLGELTSWDLLSTFSRLMRETLANQPMQVHGDPRPMRFYVTNLARTIRNARKLSLTEMITSMDGEVTRESLVGSFCALLELIKIGLVQASQGDRRGDIEVTFQDDCAEDVDDLLGGATFEDEEVSDEVLQSDSPEQDSAGKKALEEAQTPSMFPSDSQEPV